MSATDANQQRSSRVESPFVERPMSPVTHDGQGGSPFGGRSVLPPYDRTRLGSPLGDRCRSPSPSTILGKPGQRSRTPEYTGPAMTPRDRSLSPIPRDQAIPYISRSKSPANTARSQVSSHERMRSPVYIVQDQSKYRDYERSLTISGRRSVSPTYHELNETYPTVPRCRSPSALNRSTGLPPGVTVVTVRPRSTPPDIKLNIEPEPDGRPVIKSPTRSPRTKSNDPRTRYSVGDLQTLLRNGYAADPDGGHLRKSWSGSRKKLSMSLQDGLSIQTSLDSGESDSGLGDDLWWQYKSILQQKKKLILEEHTLWVNDVLKQACCTPVDDLVRSIADGQTLANLLRILTEEKVTVAHGNPVQFSQKAENLQHCIDHLNVNGVDTQGVNGKQLADGNLKSTLVLMNNLRKKYDSPQTSNYPPRSSSGDRDPAGSMSLQTRPPTGHTRYPTDRGVTPSGGHNVPKRSTTPVQRSDYSAARRTPELRAPSDLLPGTIAADRPPPRPQLPHSMTNMSTTELHHDSVIQHGVNGEQRSHSSVEFSKASSRGQNPQDYNIGHPPASNPPPPPSAATHAWQSNSGNPKRHSNTATGPSMDGRSHGQILHPAKSGSMPASNGIVNNAYVYDDGELLVPPKPRDIPHREDHGSSRFSYVPSHPNDRPPEGARPTNISSPHIQSSTQKTPVYNRNTGVTVPPNYLPPPQYNRPVSQPRPPGTSESPSLRERAQILNGRGTPQPNPQQSSHPQIADTQCHSATPGQRGNDHSYNGYNRTSQSQPSSLTSRPQPLHISNGRTSPQGQSSTPASQSPNHDKSTPSPYSSHNYVNVHSPKEGQSNVHPRFDQQKQNSQNQSHTTQKPTSNSGSFHRNSGQIGPRPSSAYPNVANKEFMSPGYSKMSSSPHAMRPSSPQVRPEPGPSKDHHRQQSVKSESNSHPTSLKADQLYGSVSAGAIQTAKVPQSPAFRDGPRLEYSRETPENRYHTTQQHIEMHKLSKGRPTSRGQHAESQWKDPESWKDRPPNRASAEWEDSDDSSITPPLPPLSPSNTPPRTPPVSPIKNHRTDPNMGRFPGGYGTKTPSAKGSAQKRRGRRSGGSVIRMDGGWKKSGPGRSAYRSPGRAIIVGGHHGSEDDLDSADNGSTTNVSGAEDWDDTMNGTEVRQMRQQMEGLEAMYAEILKMVGMDKEYLPGSRGSISSISTVSRTTGGRRYRSNVSTHRTARELRQVNKRFTRLESHVVTLARSVAHLSSEMRAQNALYQELEDLKKDVRHMKKEKQHSQHLIPGGVTADLTVGADGKPTTDWERFRGWIPSITNPKRVKKLAKFFGQDRLLHYFLEKLGYTKYIKNFEAEEITILELPYMNEERLQRLGIPMGPRQRILQEAQLCFRQENFSIYIV